MRWFTRVQGPLSTSLALLCWKRRMFLSENEAEKSDQRKRKLEKGVYSCNTDLYENGWKKALSHKEEFKNWIYNLCIFILSRIFKLSKKQILFHVPWFDHILECFKRSDIFPARAVITHKAGELLLLEFLLGRWEATFVLYRCYRIICHRK